LAIFDTDAQQAEDENFGIFFEYTECFTDLGKFDNGGLILSSSQFSLLPRLPQKIKLASKVAKIDSKQLAR
jgi:hypothetical protein